MRTHSILYDRIGTGEFLHFFTRSLNGVFFEVLERRGGYDRYGEANAAVRLASQAMLDQTPSRRSPPRAGEGSGKGLGMNRVEG